MTTSASSRQDRSLGARWRHLRDSLRQGLGIALALFLSLLGDPSLGLFGIGALLAAAGIATRLWASGHIRKNRRLATGGPYARVRHPLYVGNLLITIGFCVGSGRWWAYPLMLVFWLVFYPNAIGSEDANLERLFGDDWRSWREATPALIPKLRGRRPAADTRWSFAASWRNGEPLIAAFLAACLAILLRRL